MASLKAVLETGGYTPDELESLRQNVEKLEESQRRQEESRLIR